MADKESMPAEKPKKKGKPPGFKKSDAPKREPNEEEEEERPDPRDGSKSTFDRIS